MKKEECPTCTVQVNKWYKERFYQVLILTIIILTISYLIPLLNPLLAAFTEYIKIIWWAVLLGFFIGGFIDYFVPEEYIAKYLSKKKKTTILNAVLLGFIMSACSHGILAISIELYKKGASIPAVIAFLLASPWANFTITLLLFSFFGVNALMIIIGAIIIAIITGFIYQYLDKKGLIEQSRTIELEKNFSIMKDIRKRKAAYNFNLKKDLTGLFKGAWKLNKMVTWWILIGILLASVARTFISESLFHQYMGPTVLGLFVTLILATIIEVCSEGSSPLAFEIFQQTGAFGNSFVFLLAGVVTDYTEIGLIWSNIGRKSAIWLPIIAGPQVLLLGYLFNVLL